MPEPPQMRFHRAAVELLGYTPPVSDASIALLERQEQRHGFVFPASVREWYALEGAADLLYRYSNEDPAVPLDQLGEELGEAELLTGDRLGSQLVVVVQEENQSVCQWGFLLDGSDDPAVYVETEVGAGPATHWDLHSAHFSTFVYTHVWDWSSPCWDDGACHLEAQDQPLSPADLAYLQSRFTEAPRTYGWPAATTYRFVADDARLLIWDRDGPVSADHGKHTQYAYWVLWAGSPETMTWLAQQVMPCGNLSRELVGIDECGEEVIERLFPGRADPWRPQRPQRPQGASADDIPS